MSALTPIETYIYIDGEWTEVVPCVFIDGQWIEAEPEAAVNE